MYLFVAGWFDESGYQLQENNDISYCSFFIILYKLNLNRYKIQFQIQSLENTRYSAGFQGFFIASQSIPLNFLISLPLLQRAYPYLHRNY